jgi:hypothetical protein
VLCPRSSTEAMPLTEPLDHATRPIRERHHVLPIDRSHTVPLSVSLTHNPFLRDERMAMAWLQEVQEEALPTGRMRQGDPPLISSTTAPFPAGAQAAMAWKPGPLGRRVPPSIPESRVVLALASSTTALAPGSVQTATAGKPGKVGGQMLLGLPEGQAVLSSISSTTQPVPESAQPATAGKPGTPGGNVFPLIGRRERVPAGP